MIESKNFDFKIDIVFPFLTKDLKDKDSDKINATGNFTFVSRPQVDTAVGPITSLNFEKISDKNDTVKRLKNGFASILGDIERIEKAMEAKARHITLKYDPELSENEALAEAEESIFGLASGNITYGMYKEVLDFENKIDKYISHQSIENGGVLGGNFQS
jgi:hypothetical protein